MTNDRGQWRGVGGIPGWQRATQGAYPSLTAPSSLDASTNSDGSNAPTLPKYGLPVALPPNTYIPVTGQSLIIDEAQSVAAGATDSIFSFTVPQQYNGWIISITLDSLLNFNNSANRLTYFTPLLNNQRIWPFVGDPNRGFGIYASSFAVNVPLQIESGNTLSFNVTNGYGVADTIEVVLAGWLDQNYVPIAGANRVG